MLPVARMWWGRVERLGTDAATKSATCGPRRVEHEATARAGAPRRDRCATGAARFGAGHVATAPHGAGAKTPCYPWPAPGGACSKCSARRRSKTAAHPGPRPACMWRLRARTLRPDRRYRARACLAGHVATAPRTLRREGCVYWWLVRFGAGGSCCLWPLRGDGRATGARARRACDSCSTRRHAKNAALPTARAPRACSNCSARRRAETAVLPVPRVWRGMSHLRRVALVDAAVAGVGIAAGAQSRRVDRLCCVGFQSSRPLSFGSGVFSVCRDPDACNRGVAVVHRAAELWTNGPCGGPIREFCRTPPVDWAWDVPLGGRGLSGRWWRETAAATRESCSGEGKPQR